MRIARHRKIDDEALALFRAEIEKRLSLKTYKELAEQSGLTVGSVEQLMAQLRREQLRKIVVVHRGAKVVDIRSLAEAATLP